MADRRPVLVTTGEVLSRHIRFRFGSAEELQRGLFGLARGDAGAALLLDPGGAGDGVPSLGRFVTQGRHWRAAYVAAGGAWRGSDLSEGDVKVDLEQFGDCAMEVLPPLLGDVVAGCGWELEELLVVSNLPETRAAAVVDRAGLARARVATSVKMCGDTGAAAIPLALCQAADDGLPAGARVVLLGAASGFGGAAVPLVW
jgi:3-oxoacyl-[acyl-carrier-protein] synthase III